MKRLLEFRNVLLGYGGKAVLPEINLTVYEKDFLGVVGPNGAGKTTLLKAILGLIKPIEGHIIHHKNHRYGYVPQREKVDEMFPLTARDIVMMSRFPLCSAIFPPGKSDREAVQSALEMVGISDIADKLFRSLSGGQKQRTLIARALATQPDILILDEPTNGMDIRAEKSTMDLISELNGKGITVIMVTHLLNLVANRANKLVLLNEHILQGKVSEVLTSDALSATYGGEVGVFHDAHNQCHVVAR
ncbi:MAG: metal ABC transporter ATP-binding protein [Candidatus Eremiobacteraeota bacterium]|nr:metal ABC transporter ATP-binding protein [Candidatus Eremiobacteraeota bacterium]